MYTAYKHHVNTLSTQSTHPHFHSTLSTHPVDSSIYSLSPTAGSSSSKKDQKDATSSRASTGATAMNTDNNNNNHNHNNSLHENASSPPSSSSSDPPGDPLLQQVLERACPELLSLLRSLASALFHPGPWVRLGARFALRELAQHYATMRDGVKAANMGKSDNMVPSGSSSSSSPSSSSAASVGPLSPELRDLLQLVTPHIVVTSPSLILSSPYSNNYPANMLISIQ